jgi:hypothetical protein
VIAGFCFIINEISALLGCYTVYSGNSLPTFRDNLLVPSPSHRLNPLGWHRTITTHTFLCINHVPKCDQFSSCISLHLKMGPIGCPKTSVRNYRRILCIIPEERKSQCFISLHALGRSHQVTGVYRHSRIVVPQYQTCFMPSFWHVEFGGGS